MSRSTINLVIYSVLVTLGIVLMALGVTWLMFLGVALALLASFFSTQDPPGIRRFFGFLLYSIFAIVILLRDSHAGDTFAHQWQPSWWWIVLAAIWLYCIISEFRGRREARH